MGADSAIQVSKRNSHPRCTLQTHHQFATHQAIPAAFLLHFTLCLPVTLQRYSKLKAEHNLYDRPDLVHWIYSRLSAQGYHGCAITHILRDEVQDFVQGELLLDGLVRADG
jgi:hypothetical protein